MPPRQQREESMMVGAQELFHVHIHPQLITLALGCNHIHTSNKEVRESVVYVKHGSVSETGSKFTKWWREFVVLIMTLT